MIERDNSRTEEDATQDYAALIAPPSRAAFDVSPQSHTLVSPREAEIYLDELEKQVPNAEWMVLIDGEVDQFATEIAESVYRRSRARRLTHLTRSPSPAGTSDGLNGFEVLSLNPDDPDDLGFVRSLPADIVVVPARKKESDEAPPQDRWGEIARFVLREVSAEQV